MGQAGAEAQRRPAGDDDDDGGRRRDAFRGSVRLVSFRCSWPPRLVGPRQRPRRRASRRRRQGQSLVANQARHRHRHTHTTDTQTHTGTHTHTPLVHTHTHTDTKGSSQSHDDDDDDVDTKEAEIGRETSRHGVDGWRCRTRPRKRADADGQRRTGERDATKRHAAPRTTTTTTVKTTTAAAAAARHVWPPIPTASGQPEAAVGLTARPGPAWAAGSVATSTEMPPAARRQRRTAAAAAAASRSTNQNMSPLFLFRDPCSLSSIETRLSFPLNRLCQTNQQTAPPEQLQGYVDEIESTEPVIECRGTTVFFNTTFYLNEALILSFRVDHSSRPIINNLLKTVTVIGCTETTDSESTEPVIDFICGHNVFAVNQLYMEIQHLKLSS